MKYLILTLLIFFFVPSVIVSAEDVIVETKDGREVVLHENGSWEYYSTKESSPKTTPKSTFRKANWGMTMGEVREIEKAKFFQEDDLFLAYEGKLSGFAVYIVYIFVDNKLVRAKYAINEEHLNGNDYIADYKALKELLTKKYDKPIEDEQHWKSDLYKDDPQQWGFAVSMGDLVYYSTWELMSTTISMYLTGDNFKTQHMVEYVSKELGVLEEKKNENKALDDL
jgi:hypothetical protein